MKRRMVFVMLMATAASGLTTGMASAADKSQPYTKAPPVSPAYDWSGFYAGIYTAGLRVGYNRQYGSFLLGGEAELGHVGSPTSDVGDGGKLKQTWNTGVRARAGVVIDRALLYTLAGYNLTKFEADGTITSGDKWVSGYDLGAGIEYAIIDNLSIGLEYDYSRFNNVKSVIGGVTKKKSIGDHSLRVGLNFKF
jgi:outer membrane immunogenic protein